MGNFDKIENFDIFVRVAKEMDCFDYFKAHISKENIENYPSSFVFLLKYNDFIDKRQKFNYIANKFNLYSYVYDKNNNRFVNIFDDLKSFIYENNLIDDIKQVYNIKNKSDDALFFKIKNRLNDNLTSITEFFSSIPVFCEWLKSQQGYSFWDDINCLYKDFLNQKYKIN